MRAAIPLSQKGGGLRSWGPPVHHQETPPPLYREAFKLQERNPVPSCIQLHHRDLSAKPDKFKHEESLGKWKSGDMQRDMEERLGKGLLPEFGPSPPPLLRIECRKQALRKGAHSGPSQRQLFQPTQRSSSRHSKPEGPSAPPSGL
ncbi:hypothetical protein SKAU_G00421280 [Synaphobranchus kaupii]|uniref:Uncharacterized protein n=1 Tax=Synaphobranchus kaupii TaxID=118154 RepID=A0A9Q1E6T9_SYNKA|nr:hypothetical protein SKAU_G00421280 [Synaphobranchus kaupii]